MSTRIELVVPSHDDCMWLYNLRRNNRQWFFGDIVPFAYFCQWLEGVKKNPDRDFFLCRRKDTFARVGTVGLTIDRVNKRAEYGNLLVGNSFRQQGYAKEAMSLLLEYAFDLVGIHKVFGYVFADNEAAIKLDVSLGFMQEGMLRDHVLKNGEYRDIVLMSILEDEYKT